MSAPDKAALRALFDCGCIRARLDHPGYSRLVSLGYASATPFPQHENDPHPLRQYRLTHRGTQIARGLFE